jgi:hypothetical protein
LNRKEVDREVSERRGSRLIVTNTDANVLDSGVLITAARSRGADQKIALSILLDSNRVFLTTPILALEVVPKAAFYRQELELSFYERYMASATTYRGLYRIEKVARTESGGNG